MTSPMGCQVIRAESPQFSEGNLAVTFLGGAGFKHKLQYIEMDGTNDGGSNNRKKAFIL